MNGIGAISRSTALRIIQPVAQTGNDSFFRRDDKAARQAYATSGAGSGPRNPTAGGNAAFITQLIANDNMGSDATPAQVAIAYIEARYRLTDLPAGFLIAKSA